MRETATIRVSVGGRTGVEFQPGQTLANPAPSVPKSVLARSLWASPVVSPFTSVQGRLIAFCAALLLIVVGTHVVHQRLLRAEVGIDRDLAAAARSGELIESAHGSFVVLRLSIGREALARPLTHASGEAYAEARTEATHRFEQSLRDLAESDPERAAPMLAQARALPARVREVIASFDAKAQAATSDPFTQLGNETLALEHELDRLRGEQRQRLANLRAEDREASREALRWAERLTIVATALSVALVILTARQVIAPLRRTAAALRQIQAGETEVDLPTASADEFGDMALALRQFIEHARRLDEIAYTDPLTGLSNRARLERMLSEAVGEHDASGQSVALLFLDLDHFKNVNDSLGHRFGNLYLLAAAERLRGAAPREAALFRFSGDQFAVLLKHQPKGGDGTARWRTLAEQLRSGLSAPCRLDGQVIAMSASIGVAVYPRDAEDADEWLVAAEAAMYQAKNAGRNQVVVATPELTSRVRRRSFLAGDIWRGLDADEFEVFFQPVVDVAERRVVSAEVLLRWHHPTRGLVMPAEFVPAAEESGAISALGLYSLERACAQVERFVASGRPLGLAVNLSSAQMYNSDFVKAAAEAMQRCRVEPQRLEFEITETVMMKHPDRSARVLQELHALGVRLCIDDFGTGYSSLSYVQTFPIQKIKIDRSFVARIVSSREAEAIVTATLSMARSLKFEVVAEGVETVEQMRCLLELGCPLQQGFLFTPALPAAEFEYWMESAPTVLSQIT